MSLKPSGVFISMSVPRRYVQKWAPCEMTPSRKAWPWTRLPTSRPCMSVMATTIVSIWPSRTISSSSRRRRCLVAWPASWSLMVGLRFDARWSRADGWSPAGSVEHRRPGREDEGEGRARERSVGLELGRLSVAGDRAADGLDQTRDHTRLAIDCDGDVEVGPVARQLR